MYSFINHSTNYFYNYTTSLSELEAMNNSSLKLNLTVFKTIALNFVFNELCFIYAMSYCIWYK